VDNKGENRKINRRETEIEFPDSRIETVSVWTDGEQTEIKLRGRIVKVCEKDGSVWIYALGDKGVVKPVVGISSLVGIGYGTDINDRKFEAFGYGERGFMSDSQLFLHNKEVVRCELTALRKTLRDTYAHFIDTYDALPNGIYDVFERMLEISSAYPDLFTVGEEYMDEPRLLGASYLVPLFWKNCLLPVPFHLVLSVGTHRTIDWEWIDVTTCVEDRMEITVSDHVSLEYKRIRLQKGSSNRNVLVFYFRGKTKVERLDSQRVYVDPDATRLSKDLDWLAKNKARFMPALRYIKGLLRRKDQFYYLESGMVQGLNYADFKRNKFLALKTLVQAEIDLNAAEDRTEGEFGPQ